MVIGKNITLDIVLNLIFSISQKGIIEFVPKNDMAIKTMLQIKDDIYHNYTKENFLKIVRNKANILNQKIISKSGRLLVTFKKKQIIKWHFILVKKNFQIENLRS